MQEFVYSIWPADEADEAKRLEEAQRLSRRQAVHIYGETTVAALEAVVLVNPGRGAGLLGGNAELLVELAPDDEPAETEDG